MKYTISSSQSAPLLKINLSREEKIRIERGAMVYHNGKVEIEGKTNGGILKSIGRSIVSGESMFITEARGLENDAIIAIAPSSIGKIVKLDCGGENWILNDGVFLACDNSIEYEVKRVSGIGKAILGGSGGLYNMVTKGYGDLFVNAFGDIEKIDIMPGENVIIDNYHVVAWSQNLDYELKISSGVFGFKGGEGLVMDFKGSGTVYIQTRNISNLAQEVSKYIPTT